MIVVNVKSDGRHDFVTKNLMLVMFFAICVMALSGSALPGHGIVFCGHLHNKRRPGDAGRHIE
jgi:hypothetical protein